MFQGSYLFQTIILGIHVSFRGCISNCRKMPSWRVESKNVADLILWQALHWFHQIRVTRYGCFQKDGKPPNHPFVHRVFHEFSPSILGVLPPPIFGSTSIYSKNITQLSPPGSRGMMEMPVCEAPSRTAPSTTSTLGSVEPWENFPHRGGDSPKVS